MAAGNFGLEQLVQPLSTGQFFSDYWEKKYLLLQRHDPDYFQHLLTAADLENLICGSDMRYPALQLAKGGGYFPPEAYTRNVKHGDESFMGVPDLKTISEQYRQGATLTLPALHRTWAPLGLLCENLQARLDHAPHANVYITPGNAAGFTPHYDVHEVFVLQIAGKKRWTLYEAPIELPHRTQVFNPQTYKPTTPLAEVDLSAGDTLYLPRGVVHSTTTSDSYSAHITIGISVYTWVDLARGFLQSCIESPTWRQALPPGFASRGELQPLLRQKMGAALDHLRSNSDPDRLIDAFTHRVRSSQVQRPEPFRADVSVIDLQSRLQAPASSEYRIFQEGANVILEFRGRRHVLPATVESTLRAMVERPFFRTGDLSNSANADTVLGLSRYLHEIGFLTPARS
jgi:ribosomal protein L16 Arg81 hydroxylase